MLNKREYFIPFGAQQDHSLDYLVGILNDARTTTILSIQNLSVEELDWQYRDGWNTIGALLSHIIAVENYFRIAYAEGRKLSEEETQVLMPGLEMGKYLPQLIRQKPIDQYIAELSESRQALLASLGRVSFEDFSQCFVSSDYYNAECNLAWILYHMVEDEIYHRGQISLIRKLYKEKTG